MSARAAAVLTVSGLLVLLGSVPSSGSPKAAERRAERVDRTAYTTGYTFFDNTPPGRAISHPQRHRRAGGKGTFRNPITIAVGHRIRRGRDILDYRPGTRLYLPHLRRYFVVEDTCGDGPRPQRGPCHDLGSAPRRATTWVDVWVGGKRGDDRMAVQKCASKITDGDGRNVHRMVVDARRGYPVRRGPLFHDGHCTRLFPGAVPKRRS